jgi:protein-L-isoaspartate(D-aspartate) O-methyltransferase
MSRVPEILFAILLASCLTCRAETPTTTQSAAATTTAAATTSPAEAAFARQRADMVQKQLAARDITNERVLEAMGRVPRHRFVLPRWEAAAYDDDSLPINGGQTISQPYIVALMTQLADPKPGDRVLDIGTGSGYQAAVLAEIGADVSSIEIVPALAQEAATRLRELKYDKLEVRAGDGYRGWPDKAPFKAIILAAASPEIPKPLIEQLAVGGKLVLPVGQEGGVQDLLVVTKQNDGSLLRKTVAPVRFVPMTGEIRKRDKR